MTPWARAIRTPSRPWRPAIIITTQSYQFTADIAALGPYGRGYRRVKFIFDTSDGTPKIVYRQDLTQSRVGPGQRGAPELGSSQGNTMISLTKLDLRKRQRLSGVLGLALDGSRLDGVALRRTDGALHVQQSFSVSLSLDPLTNDPELVGREIRNHLDAVGVRERQCVVGLPLKWALTTHIEVPELPEADVASFLQIEAERGFPCDVADAACRQLPLSLPDRQTTRHAGGHSEEPPGGAGAGAAGGQIEAGQLFSGHHGVAAGRD